MNCQAFFIRFCCNFLGDFSFLDVRRLLYYLMLGSSLMVFRRLRSHDLWMVKIFVSSIGVDSIWEMRDLRRVNGKLR